MNKAGKVVNKAKSAIENELQSPVVTSDNYIELTNNNKLMETK